MARYLLHHRHQPGECGVVFASFKGNQSCFATAPRCLLPSGGHEIWCTVDASEADAARPLPFFYVAQPNRPMRQRGPDPMTALGITARTTARDFGRFVLAE